jgi:hypothetical protein
VDVAVLPAIPGTHGERYIVTVLDEFTGWKEVLLLQRKQQIPEAVEACLLKLMNRRGSLNSKL